MSVPGDLSELDAQIEEIFDRADDLMINQKEYFQAVRSSHFNNIIQMQLYKDILALDPYNIDGLNSLAQCVKLQKSPPTNETFEECYNLYNRALAVDPEDFETNFNIGVLLYEFRKDLDKAIHFFKVAVNEEANATTLFNLAVIYEEKGDRNEAKKTY